MSPLAAYPDPSPPQGGLGRPAVVLSLVVHVVAFVVVLGVPRLLASSSKAAPVYVVDLVSFGGGSPGAAAPPAAAPPSQAPPAAEKPAPKKPKVETPPPKPKKAPEKSIVIPERGAKMTAPKAPRKPEPPKPEPEAKSAAAEDNTDSGEAKETTEPQPAASAPAAGKSSSGPGAPGGTPGGTGLGGQGTGVGGDAYNFYLVLLDRSIKGAWKRPLYNGQDVLSATVRLEISRSGRVLKLDLVTASGNEALDKSVLKAVRDAEPFPPLPTTLSLDTLPVQIVFELNPQAGSGG